MHPFCITTLTLRTANICMVVYNYDVLIMHLITHMITINVAAFPEKHHKHKLIVEHLSPNGATINLGVALYFILHVITCTDNALIVYLPKKVLI